MGSNLHRHLMSKNHVRTTIKSLITAGFALSSLVTVASPVYLDTPEAHIIVTRPIDRWSPDSLQQDGAVMWTREFMPAFWGTTPRPQVSLVWLNWSFFGDSSRKTNLDSNTPLMSAIRAGVIEPRFKAKDDASAWKFFIRDEALHMTPKQTEDFVAARNLMFKNEVEGALLGTSGQSIFSSVARVGSAAVSLGVGMAGVKAFDGSSLPVGGMGIGAGNAATDFFGAGSTAYKLVTDTKAITPPINFDFSTYVSVQYRSIELLAGTKVYGDVYIAYKAIQNPDVQAAVEAKAILLAMGMGATKSEIDSARAEELMLREKIRSSATIPK